MRIRTIAILGIAAIVIAWGVARGALGRPSSVDRYIVNDGDTFLMVPKDCVFSLAKLGCPTQRLRLEGVDAFESKQTCRDARDMEWACGEAATERLRALTRRPDFTCRVDPEFVDRHAREFSLCFADGRDVGATMVNEGLAFAYGRDTSYLPLENEAKAAKRGAWAGHFIRPQYFRQGATD